MRAARQAHDILVRLEKAVHAGNITEVVPEDLELESHNTLWSETDETELTLLKLMPSVPATSVTHEFNQITSFGNKRGSGFFGERSLPPETNFQAERVEVAIKLMGEIGPTFLLAAMEKTVKALGTSGAQNIERSALRLNVLWKKNRNLYKSDTTLTRGGDDSVRFKGLEQQIREGTDGTTGTSPYGSHIIDMAGDPLTIDTIRDRIGKGITLFGAFRCLLMDPLSRSDLEASMDAAQRLPLPIQASPHAIGQQIAGIRTQGGITYFETDNTLSSIYYQGQYSTDTADGYPTGKPTVVASAGADGSSGFDSKWTADYAGDHYWVVTEVVDELEGLGTRAPATLGSYTTVAASQEVTLTLTPSSSEVDSFKVYRGSEAQGDDALTDAWFIFEVASSDDGSAVTAYDDNLEIPNTTRAFGLNIISGSEEAMHQAVPDRYYRAALGRASYLEGNDRPRNTVALAHLGPTMGVMALASILAEVDRPLVYSACCPEVRNPFQQVVFKNIGRA